MFIELLVVTFLIAVAVCFVVVLMFSSPINKILARIISDPIHKAWSRYLKFAIFITGISSGVRIWDLEKYITERAYEGAKVVELTGERWVLEVYRTVIGTLAGIAWMLLVFFVFALVAYVIVRVFEMRKKPAQ